MKKLPILLLLILSLGHLKEAEASHVQGMNIAYKHINGDTFELIFDLFKYCGGTAFSPTGNPQSAIGAPATAAYTIYCDQVGWSSGTLQAEQDTSYEVSPICAAQAFLSTCPNSPSGLLGTERYTYKDTIVLSELVVSTCPKWRIVWAISARNSGTNYISQPTLTVYNDFYFNDFPTNSSVQFNSAKPIPFFCDGQQVVYNWGAFELDGDSLFWELDTAIDTYNANLTQFNYVNYNTVPAGMATVNGLEPIPGITIDNATGQVEFTAFIPPGYNFANYAVAVKVSEYDPNTGALKGVVQRDVQFIVMDSCANNPPLQDTAGITNFNGTGALEDSNTVIVCFGQSFEFDLLFFDFDSAGNFTADSLNVSCNIGDILPGATWSHTGTNPDTVTVQWTAIPTNITFAPFNVTVEDENCPITGFNIYNYVIKIVPSTFLPADTAICSTDTIDLTTIGGDTFTYEVIMNPDSTFGPPLIPGVNIECNPCYGNENPWLHLDSTTTIRVESNLDVACGNEDTITVTVFSQFPISITPVNGGTPGGLVYCASDGLDTLNGFTPGGIWLGSGIVNPVNGVFAPDILNPGSGNDTTVQIVYIIATEFCPNEDTVSIVVKGLPDTRILSEGPFCSQTMDIQLQGVQSGGIWTGPNTTSSGLFDASAFASTAPDTVLIFHSIDDGGCINTDSAFIRVIDEFSSNIENLPKICAGDEELLLLNDYEADPNGIWKGNKVFEEPVGSGKYYFDTKELRAGSFSITYEIEGDCGTATTTPVIINPLPDASIYGADSVYCDNIVDSVLLSTELANGIWGGNMNELHDGYFVPSRIGEGLYNISYELYDTLTTCYNKTVVPVRIARTPVRPTLFDGGPFCQGTSVSIRADGLLSNTFKWFGVSGGDSVLLGAGNPFDFGAVTDLPETIIYGTQVSEFGCESPAQIMRIEVLPAPIADFEVDTVYGSVPFEVNFLNLSSPDSIPLYFTWTFADYGTSNDSNTSFTFEEIGSYLVTLNTTNGQCDNEKSITILADKLTDFFIPNVITPNSDGFNDELEWKIDGIGQFKISVYNRWGMRVFQTEDITEFWDGGSEPSGVYYYVMTGVEETLDQEKVEWRGDVTLIRD